jgi:hypothetical protein
VLGERSQAEVIASVQGIEQLSSVRTLVKALVPAESQRY